VVVDAPRVVFDEPQTEESLNEELGRDREVSPELAVEHAAQLRGGYEAARWRERRRHLP